MRRKMIGHPIFPSIFCIEGKSYCIRRTCCNIPKIPINRTGRDSDAINRSTTIGVLITPITMFYSDISKLIAMGLKLLMYITPIVYAIPKSGNLKTIMEYNPFTPIILTGRDLILGVTPHYLTYFLILMLVCIPLFLLALAFYRVSIPIFVERLNA